NDNYGHHAGDKFLKEVSQRILYSLRPGDVVGRMAGDEFIVILDDIAKPEDVQLVCNKILSNLEKIEIGDIIMDITLSIGISIYPEDTENVEDLIKFADMAMYKSKEKGKNTFEFYSKEMAQRFKYRIEMINKIQNAIKNSSFTVFYQPIIDIKDLKGQTEEEIKQEIVSKGLIIGLEALIRWFENGKIIPPLEFIPLAEETNLILPIGRIVLDLSTKQISKFEKKLFINVSAKEFEYPLYFEQLVKILEKNSFNPRFLSIEITEGIVIKNIDKFLDIASDLRKLGIEICIDDFGVGYSSLSSLINIPASVIKIDRSFIAQITKDKKVRRIIKGIIDISKILGFKVVAEGIETFEQLKIVNEYGCDYAQGFFFFKPAPIEEIEKFL
ncbi:MAG: putative bifunctional diguanylate cyclase/phosphodiesterase, partial [bacterium]